MLKDYCYCHSSFRAIFFDGAFAKEYGVVEGIIFNDLYCCFTEGLQMRRSRKWRESEDGWLEEGGRWWQRCPADSLFKRYESLFDEQERKNAIKTLCDAGLLYIRPSMTDGYYWITIGEEQNDE